MSIVSLYYVIATLLATFNISEHFFSKCTFVLRNSNHFNGLCKSRKKIEQFPHFWFLDASAPEVEHDLLRGQSMTQKQ